MNDESVGVIVVSYNSEEYLPTLMESMAAAEERDIEVRLIDNGSGDHSREWIGNYCSAEATPKYIWPTGFAFEENTGFTHAVNSGLKYLLTNHPEIEYFALVNPDVILCEDWLSKQIAIFTTHPRCGIITCRQVRGSEVIHGGGEILSDPRPLYEQVEREIAPGVFVEENELVCYSRVRHRRGHLVDDSWNVTDKVPWGTFACVMLRREMVEEIGLLDERFFNYCSDCAYCIRAWEHNWEVWYTGDVTVYHHVGASEASGGNEVLQRKIADLRLFAQEEPRQWPD